MEMKNWWKEAVVYQIYPRSFMDSNGDGIGDINGIRQKLDYIKNLGVDVIWISPFYQSPGVDNGYDISDYQAINPEFGTMEDFDAMLKEAHEKGLKIVVDLVVNHTSNQHKWFLESRKSKDNPYRDFYIWKDGKGEKGALPPNNWGSVFSGPAWERDELTGQYYLHLFAKEQPDLNWENPKVREEIFSMMNWWCKKGVDGFRMDVIGFIKKNQAFPDGKVNAGALYGDFGPYCVNLPGVHDFLKEMNEKVLSKYNLFTVGETAGVTTSDAKLFAGFDSKELEMVFQFERIDAEADGCKWIEKPIDLVRMKKIFEKWQVELEGKAWNSLYWENHDQPRIVSRYRGDGKYRELCSKMLAVCLYFQKGTPYIYQGQELGMTNSEFENLDDFRDVETFNAFREFTTKKENPIPADKMMQYLNRVSRDNARTPMQWNAEKNAGFSDGTPWIGVNKNYKEINAEKQVKDENSVYNFFRTINKIRKENDIVVYGKFQLLEKENQKLVIYTRELEGKKLLVVCNFFEEPCEYQLPEEFKKGKLLLSNYESFPQKLLRPYEAAVISI